MKTAVIFSCFVLSALSACAGVSGILDPRARKNRWTSAPVALPAHRVPADVRLSFVCRGPVEINGRILFTDATGAPKGFYRFSPALKVPSKSGWNRPGSHSVCVPAYGIPEGAANAAVELMAFHRPAAGGEAPVFEITGLDWDFSATPVGLQPENWFSPGEDAVFVACVPEGCKGIRGTVTDSSGREVFRADADGDVWRWKDPRPGFYKVRFSWIEDSGATRECRGSTLYVGDIRRENGVQFCEKVTAFRRDGQNFAVGATRARSPEECPPAFGFNLEPYDWGYIPGQTPFRIVKHLGMGSFIRYHHFWWDSIEREGRGRYDWSKVDAAFERAARAGYGRDRIIVNTFGTPAGLSTSPPVENVGWMTPSRYHAPRDMQPWRDYVKAFCERYPGIRYFELWNEPHLPGYSIFWQKSSPAQFAELLKAGYEGVKEADPSITVLMGGVGMRYLPFYEELLKLGGDRWFDRLATHCGYDMRHFREAERRLGVKGKPYWEDEWHTVLYNCSDPNPPGEKECAYRMLVNLATLLHAGNDRIAGFGFCCGTKTPETVRYFAKKQGICQVSGLFRSDPCMEPRFAALALRTATDRFSGEIRKAGAWAFADDGSQRVCAFKSDAGTVAFVWCETPGEKPVKWTDGFMRTVGGKKAIDWEGREAHPGSMLSRRVYFVVDPDLDAASREGVVLRQLDHIAVSADSGSSLERGAYSQDAGMVHIPFSRTEGGFAGGFSASLDENALTVETVSRSGRFESVRFALDVEGKGSIEDTVEFLVTADGTAVKPRTPVLKGDIPPEFSPANVPLVKSRMERFAQDGGERWRITAAMSDLYPFVRSPGRELRFSIAARGEAGGGSWGGGFGRIRRPSQFGMLRPTGKGKVLALQDAIRGRFGDAAVVPGEIASVRALSGKGPAGFSVTVSPLPGSVIRATALLRGAAKIEPVAWADGVRINAEKFELSPEWRRHEIRWDFPATAKKAMVALFSWRNGAAAFEVKDFKIVND